MNDYWMTKTADYVLSKDDNGNPVYTYQMSKAHKRIAYCSVLGALLGAPAGYLASKLIEPGDFYNTIDKYSPIPGSADAQRTLGYTAAGAGIGGAIGGVAGLLTA